MEYMGNLEYWDEKFLRRGYQLMAPESSLVENLQYFKEGTVLDLACGDGRNTLFFLQNGFEVKAVDFSEVALSRLGSFTKEANFRIKTQSIDLNSPEALKGLGIFDNIYINHYRPNQLILETIKNHLSKNGILFICGFGHQHIPDSPIREDDLIQSSDFEVLGDSFQLVKYHEEQEKRGFIVTYIFTKL